MNLLTRWIPTTCLVLAFSVVSAIAAEPHESSSQAAAIKAALNSLSTPPSDSELLALIQLDRQALTEGRAIDETLLGRMTDLLALADDPRTLGYLHEIFETYPERRHLVAASLAQFATTKRCRPEDWRLLVRSLTVVEGQQARQVLQALRRFPHRATEPKWQRQVILIGLQLGESGVEDATDLLEHWSGTRLPTREDNWRDRLARWQSWFSSRYPDAPDPELPSSPPGTRWTYDALRSYLEGPASRTFDPQQGAAVFEKGQCYKCHRFRGRGESLGPDLTDIRLRLQRKELLSALLFPSERISDQFETYIVATHDGRTFTGIFGRRGADQLIVLQPNGEKITFRQQDIAESARSRTSAMPAGLLEPLSEQEIADLFAFILQNRGD